MLTLNKNNRNSARAAYLSPIAIALAACLISPMVLAQSTPSPAPSTKPKLKAPAKKPVVVTDETVTNAAAAKAATAPATAIQAAPSTSSEDKLLLKFDTNSESTSTDVRAPLKFKVPGETDAKPAPEVVNPLAEDAPYKAFIGYPKQTLGAFAEYSDLGATWKYIGQSFNFSDTPIAYGVNYKYLATPLLTFDIEYMHWSDAVTDATVLPFVIVASTYSYDTLFVGGNYCFVSELTALRRFCPGITIGRDEYPILNFGSGNLTRLTLNKVADFTIGVNAKYEMPFRDNILFTLVGGYNMGTGAGNSGSLTSTSNSSYYVKALTDWNVKGNHTANFQFDYSARAAKLEGKIGSNSPKWDTDSTIMGLRAGYTYTFQ